MTKTEINNVLLQYGATMDDNRQIVKNKPTGVIVKEVKNRFSFVTQSGFSVMSGPKNSKTIENFVERFWFWVK